MNDEQLCELLVRFVEKRALIRNPQGSLKQRLEAAEAKLRTTIPRFKQFRDGTIWQLVVERCKLTAKERARLENEVQNYDCRVRMIERGTAAILAAIVYQYFRLGRNAVDIAEDLGPMSVALIHQLIFKLNKLAKRTWPEGRAARR